jgi:hypothetical protein
VQALQPWAKHLPVAVVVFARIDKTASSVGIPFTASKNKDATGNAKTDYVSVKMVKHDKELNGCNYFLWEINFEGPESSPFLAECAIAQSHALLLPKPSNRGTGEETGADHRRRSYTLIDSDWEEVDRAGVLALPNLSISTTARQ